MKRMALVGLFALASCQQTATTNANIAAGVNLDDARRQPDATLSTGSAELPAPELEGVATASGSWHLVQSENGDQAIFELAGNTAAFSMYCNRNARQMIFLRSGAGENGKTLQLIAADGAATFPAKDDSHGNKRASDLVTDTFLTQVLAEAKGRIGVRIGTGKTMAMPSDPLIGQMIGRCAAP